jgi:hypothetical protein
VALLEITDVVPAPPNEALRAYYLDSPAVGTSLDRTTLEVSGWVIGASSPAREVELWMGKVFQRRVPVHVARPDVVAVHPGAPDRTGFWSLLGTLRLERDFRLDLRVVFEDRTAAELGSICGTRLPITSAETRFDPLLLTSLGRTGTTLLMGLLSAHPAIVADRTFPYEVFPARYWLHLLQVLAEPADHNESPNVENFALDLYRVGANPFHTAPVTNDPEMAELLGGSYVERLTRFCQQSIDEFYGALAAKQGKPSAKFFVEKSHPDHVSRVARDVYPGSREVFLVRDFRDLICSVLAFNEKRGIVDFGRAQFETDEEYVRWIGRNAKRLANAWKARQPTSYLVRYEELASRPVETLTDVLAYLGLDQNPKLVAAIVRGAFEHPDVTGHRTSRSVEESIGRWRRELPDSLRPAVREELNESLSEFGYAPQE